MENTPIRRKKYPVERIRKQQENYRKIRQSLNLPSNGSTTVNTPDASLLPPINKRFIRFYLMILVIMLIACIIPIIELPLNGIQHGQLWIINQWHRVPTRRKYINFFLGEKKFTTERMRGSWYPFIFQTKKTSIIQYFSSKMRTYLQISYNFVQYAFKNE